MNATTSFNFKQERINAEITDALEKCKLIRSYFSIQRTTIGQSINLHVGKVLTSALKADIGGSPAKLGFSNNLHDVTLQNLPIVNTFQLMTCI